MATGDNNNKKMVPFESLIDLLKLYSKIYSID